MIKLRDLISEQEIINALDRHIESIERRIKNEDFRRKRKNI